MAGKINEDWLQSAFQDVQIFTIMNDDAGKHRRKAISKLATMVQQFLNDGVMKHTIEAIAEKPLLGEPAGNCHYIALAFMTDLINAKRAQGWFWVQGENKHRLNSIGATWEHSWLEFNGFAVDATINQKEKQNQPTIVIGETEYYYKTRDIKKITRRLDPAQTRRWIFRQAKDEI